MRVAIILYRPPLTNHLSIYLHSLEQSEIFLIKKGEKGSTKEMIQYQITGINSNHQETAHLRQCILCTQWLYSLP